MGEAGRLTAQYGFFALSQPVNALCLDLMRTGAAQEIRAKVQQELSARLQRVVQNPHSAPDADACWAINAFTHNATQLSPDHAEALARLIWGGQ